MNRLVPKFPDLRIRSVLDFRNQFRIDAGGRRLGLSNYGNSLAATAEFYLGVTIDKSSRLSDWTKRPLRLRQSQYAAYDVFVLLDISMEYSRRLAILIERQTISNIGAV